MDRVSEKGLAGWMKVEDIMECNWRLRWRGSGRYGVDEVNALDEVGWRRKKKMWVLVGVLARYLKGGIYFE